MMIAHTREKSLDGAQSVYEHNQNVAELAHDICYIQELKRVCYLTGLLHDSGKYKPAFQQYICKATLHPESVHKGEVTHSTGGAFLIHHLLEEVKKNLPSKQEIQIAELLIEIMGHAIISHHGVTDCISKEGELIYDVRVKADTELEQMEQTFYEENSFADFDTYIKETMADLTILVKKILLFTRTKQPLEYGNHNFYFGYLDRIVLSCLIHADRTDTMCFNDRLKLPKQLTREERIELWGQLQECFNEKLSMKNSNSLLNQCRGDISRQCYEAAQRESAMYHLVVPTGAGKTLSGLRYALEHAHRFAKKHIFYIAPYNSILEQNAQVIRDMVGSDEAVLEHHCNIISEDERYLQLTETWESPLIMTTAVQFLETLFSSKSSSIRRFQALTDSILIIDEAQALPIRCIQLFNMAMNYLVQYADTSVILCSATMPLFDRLPQKRLKTPIAMVHIKQEHKEAFTRSEIIDDTSRIIGGMSYDEAGDYLLQKCKEARNMLVIVNTKKAANELYQILKNNLSDEVEGETLILYHLSTSMCAAHRQSRLKQMIEDINDNKKVICISTALIEAGVDISFQYVVRSLAGLDSIIQAAGRCNRSHEYSMGKVFLMYLREEKISSLVDIVQGQEAMRSILQIYHNHAEELNYSLSSDEAIRQYYSIYFMRRMEEMEYHTSDPESTLVEMLSENRNLISGMEESNRKHILLKQAFRTAGDLFQVIPEDGKTDVIVECDDVSRQLIQSIYNIEYYGDYYKQIDYTIAKRLLRRLQPYTVGISEIVRQKLKEAIYCDQELGVKILRKEYYSMETGVSEIPSQMDFMEF